MAGNIIHITFNEDLTLGSSLSLSGVYSNGIGSTVSLTPAWSWVPVRNAGYKVTTGTPTLLPGERSAINFMQAFLLDMGANGQHIAVRTGNVVTITSLYGNVAGYTWDSGIAFLPSEGGGFPPVADVVFTFSFGQNNTPFTSTIEFLAFVPDRCRQVQVKITASAIIQSISSPVADANVNSQTYTFTYSRGAAGNIVITNNQPQPLTITQAFQTPALLSPDNYNVAINNSPNGATLIITSVNQQGINPVYAISPPGTSPISGAYQTDNVFSGVAPGNYWLSIKDQFGCIKTKEFTVEETGNSRFPFFYISKSMSLRFANRVNFSDAGNYKTDENTLSCEVDVVLPYKEVQQFQTADIITTQFKSNYNFNTATIVKSDGTEIAVPVLQKTNFIGVKDKRDGIKINLGNAQTGFYFMSGNIYDYDTNVITGTHALNGTLPYWASLGTYFNVAGVWYQVSEVIYSEELNADVIVVDSLFEGVPENVIISSIYDIFNYEVYEFTIDFVDYQNQDVKVRINNDDDDFGGLVHLSERINVQVRQSGTIEIKYRNPENTDVYYATGITNLIRIPYYKKTAVPNNSAENYKTDVSVLLINSDVYEMDKFMFLPVTKEIMRKIIQALSHKTVQMDSVYYVLESSEFEESLGETNLYSISANMIKTGGAFTSTQSGDQIFDTTNIEIPGLLDIGDGSYIEYIG